ncbi:DUF4376 domain-containing protein [Aeromonas veronii]
MFYSKSTGGFYDASINGASIPSDAVEITDKHYKTLLAEQSSGKVISVNESGHPIAIAPPAKVRSHSSLQAEIAAQRWAVETGGITVSGVRIKTDRESQSQLTGVYAMLKGGLVSDTQWKTADGSFTLVTLVEIEPIAQAVAEHVRACFNEERSHTAAIAMLQTQAELDAYDIHTGWPSNSN